MCLETSATPICLFLDQTASFPWSPLLSNPTCHLLFIRPFQTQAPRFPGPVVSNRLVWTPPTSTQQPLKYRGSQSIKTGEGFEENDLQGLNSHVYSIWNVCWGEKNHTCAGITSLPIFQGSAMKTFFVGKVWGTATLWVGSWKKLWARGERPSSPCPSLKQVACCSAFLVSIKKDLDLSAILSSSKISICLWLCFIICMTFQQDLDSGMRWWLSPLFTFSLFARGIIKFPMSPVGQEGYLPFLAMQLVRKPYSFFLFTPLLSGSPQHSMAQHGMKSIPQHLKQTENGRGSAKGLEKSQPERCSMELVRFNFKSSLKLPESQREGSQVERYSVSTLEWKLPSYIEHSFQRHAASCYAISKKHGFSY